VSVADDVREKATGTVPTAVKLAPDWHEDCGRRRGIAVTYRLSLVVFGGS